MKQILVIDQGTHSTKGLLFDGNGAVLSECEEKVSLNKISDSEAEQNPKEVLDSCKTVIRNLKPLINADCIAALATQRSSLVAWDISSGEAISTILSWQDTRGRALTESLSHKRDLIKQKTGLPLSPHYGASKFRWLLDNNPEVQKAADNKQLALGSLSSFLTFNLSKEKAFAVDDANAARTLLWNIQTRNWDEDLLTLFNIPKTTLPTCKAIYEDYGTLIDSNIPIKLVGGDQNCAAFGLGPIEDSEVIVNLGTGGFVITTTKNTAVKNSELLTGIAYSSKNSQEYILEGTVNGVGAALTWAKSNWGVKDIHNTNWSEISSPPLFINTVGGLGSPYWKSGGSAKLAQGKAESHNSKELVAAVIESFLFLININIGRLKKVNPNISSIKLAGGLSQDAHLCQRLSNLSSLKVMQSHNPHATARGCAYLAADKANWDSPKFTIYKPTPDPSLNQRYSRFIELVEKL